MQKNFSLMLLHLLIFACIACALGVMPKNNCQAQCMGALSLCFLPVVLWYLALMLKSLFHLNFLWVVDYRSTIFFSVSIYPVFPPPFMDKTLLAQLSIHSFLVNFTWPYTSMQKFIFRLLILFHSFVLLFQCQYHTVLITIAMYSLTQVNSDAYNFVLSQNSFGYL